MHHKYAFLIRLATIALSVTLSSLPGWGQGSISTATLFWLADQGKSGQYAEVQFTAALEEAPALQQIHIVTMASGTELRLASARLVVGRPDVLRVSWNADVLPNENDTSAKFKIDHVRFAGTPPVSVNNVEKDGSYYTRGSVHTFIDARKKEFEDAIAVAKTSQEKDIFAGLSVAAPTKGNASGDADIHLNRWVTPNLFISTAINKSSAEGADPRHFDVSLTFRKIIPFLFSSQSGGGKSSGEILKEKNIAAARQRKLLGVLFDGGGRLEGDVTNFAVTNGIFDMPVQIASRTMGFGPLGANGHWQFRLVPVGVEVGHNLGSDNPNLQQYTIARIKSGATLGLIYQPKNDPNAFPQRVELDGQVVERYLFNDEVAWNALTKKSSGVISGTKPWYEANLKIFFVSNDQGRVGFKITFDRGSVPPVFSETRAFRFGLIFETSDDKSSQGKPSK